MSTMKVDEVDHLMQLDAQGLATENPDHVVQDNTDSESEDGNDAERKIPTTSEKRRTQDIIFSAWRKQQASKITMAEVKAVVDSADEETLSIQALMSKQESHIIIDDPREYQLELFERAKQQNTIAVLDTGSGKTLIAVLLLRYIIDQELEERLKGKRPRISFFLVDCVTLVFQQYAVLKANLDQKIERFCGEMGVDLWSKEIWEKYFANNMVIVCTAEILHQCLMHSFMSMEDINLLIFDEAHHTKKNHAYARIIKDYYVSQEMAKRPRIFGMTASPVDAKEDPVKAAKELEAMLHSQIATASDLALLRNSISRPKESIGEYAPLEYPYDTALCAKLKAEFENIEAFSKIFKFAREAASQLGEWCADQAWGFALATEESRKIEQRTERKFNAAQENRPMSVLNKELECIRKAREIVANANIPPPIFEGNVLSPKVLLLHQYLQMRYEKPTGARCIIFVKKRLTARVLGELFTRIGAPHLRLGLLIGTRKADPGDVKVSFRTQILTLARFKKGDVNCLIATSIAEEGLDIPDCNLIIRFDLYETLIQYIQSRGRARHANSRYLHMVEKENRAHIQAVDLVRRGEVTMRNFCEALPSDRCLQGNNPKLENTLAKERGLRRYVDPETGALLTYASSLVVLAHFVGCLPHHSEATQQAMFTVSAVDRKFQCEVILPESSPLRSATGRPCSRKFTARQSAAFEACCLLRQGGHLDAHLIPTYHKLLPQMRNAHLALSTNRSNAYSMKLKPSLWENTRGSRPDRLFLTIIELEAPENVGRACQPLALLSRTCLPEFPPFPIYLQTGKSSNLLCTSLRQSLELENSSLAEINDFTLRIYKDIFNKTFESDEAQMSYWLAPVFPDWKSRGPDDSPIGLIDWSIVHFPKDVVNWKVVSDQQGSKTLAWTNATPEAQLVDRFVIDPGTGGKRYFSVAIDPNMRPLDPVPEHAFKNRHMKSILDYSSSAWTNSREKYTWQHDQPVIRADKALYRLEWLEDLKQKDKEVKTECFLCPEPLRFSVLPVSVVTMCYMFPAILTRLESYLITIEACEDLKLVVEPSLALEAFTKDSDNTDEHKAEQIQLQRGMGKNYERLEFIGDCFLKMATSISIFSSSPEDNEFVFHVKRMVLICNKNLLETALRIKVYESIRSQGFSRRTWYPEGIKLLAGKGHNKTGVEVMKHHLGDKTIADVCEAIIGAALLSHMGSDDMDMAVKAVTTLVASPNHNVSKWADYYQLYEKPKYQVAEATASQLDLAKQVQQEHDYTFKYPRLLRSAFIHPSYAFGAEKIPCYQRLEFLGDALLDMVSIGFLFHRHPDKDPQWLTEHKMAMVSNKFLAALSVKLGFHRHMRFNGTNIEYQNREYVAELEDAECEANGARDYWTNTKQPPKSLSDIVESYVGALFVDSEYNYGEVERFFDQHIRWFFEDMSIYDSFANNHPTTYLHSLLTLSFGCTDYRLMAGEVEAIIPGGPSTSVAVVMIHNQIVAEGQAASSKNAKVKASSNTLKELQGLAPLEYRMQFGCNCDGYQKEWVGKDGGMSGMVGTAV